MNNPVQAVAFERKEELGGGFRGRVLDLRDKQTYDSPVLDTISKARHWAKRKVFDLMDGEPWAPGYSYKPYWRMNVWTH